MNQPVCQILGAGAGIGGNVAKRFARAGPIAVAVFDLGAQIGD
jgi:NAD(P)-dependent dehydrogenase (short-subunit alcohol dehydrogenase family)